MRRSKDPPSSDQINRRSTDSNNRGRNSRRFNQNERNNGESSTNYHQLRRNHNKGDRRNDNQYSRKPRQMGFKMLQNLIENNNEEDILTDLTDNKKGFKELLNDNKMSNDTTVLIIKVLSKICDCAFKASKTAILQSAIESEFYQKLIIYITTLSIQRQNDKKLNSYFWKDSDDFWYNIIKISDHLHDLIPSSSCECILRLLKAVKVSLPSFEVEHSINVSDEIKSKVDTLCDVVEKTVMDVERKKEVGPTNTIDEQDLNPPDNFRDISTYPSTTEVTTNVNSFLRRNIIKGSYQNIEHYLDVQYRLLREDFVLPLRKGICKYINNPKDKLEDIKIYTPVKFLNAEAITEDNCFRIQFDFDPKKKKIQYERSKSFMFGALLCFTDDRDKFKNILFGKVAQRKIELLEKGQLIVGFDTSISLPENLYDIEFLLVESKVFFEPYYQVLNVLKNMNIQDFPMERYIIEVKTDVRPPSYLLTFNGNYTIDGNIFWPLRWGTSTLCSLNESQNKAFQSALTNEIAIIQGPPGTGKTFLGLKIAKTLLKNHSAWYKNSPILVVCFTNHALDQFLEGLLDTTNNIIRVGSQSKNQNLNSFNLRNRKGRHFHNSAVASKKFELKCQMQHLATIEETLKEIEKYHGVIDFTEFIEVVPSYMDSWFYCTTKEMIIDWLFGGQNQQFKKTTENLPSPDNIDNKKDIRDVNSEDEGTNDLREEFDIEIKFTKIDYFISVDSLTKSIEYLEKKLSVTPEGDFAAKMNLTKTLDYLDYLKYQMNERKSCRNIVAPKYIDMKNPHSMHPQDRWQLYFYWLSLYETSLRREKETAVIEIRKLLNVSKELLDIEDVKVMKDAKVVGMTTTGAARINASLQALKSPIVIVEEAAEVLEAHVIAALTSHCQHLILIGDHQQLKPSTASYLMETKYNLNVSLFQRMVDNDVQCHTLNVQHRMIPQIADLIRPTIYPTLYDHESVFNRPSIKGVVHNLFFIHHQEKEQLSSDNSKKNIHEAKFFIHFARHLILNGYKPENIIILVAYLGQMFHVLKEREKHSHLLKDVRIAVLDNYQGEECDIVLLSLVRSNSENKIGFLKIDNRVCVALSRARNGLYIMGNMELLCNNSEIWSKIKQTLEQKKAIGSYLELYCQIHRNHLTNVKNAEDFLKLPEGGCDLLCESELACGHNCKRLCHIEDREHALSKCRETCGKLLCEDQTHLCRKQCYQACGPCTYPVKRTVNCGHLVTMYCHIDLDEYKCTELVEKTLPCEHRAKILCFEDPETFSCPHPCNFRLDSCGHSCKRNCHVRDDPDHLQYKCKKPCVKVNKGCTYETPHLCEKSCFEECKECVKIVRKKLSCGHLQDMPCNADPETIVCTKPCKRVLPCGHKCKNICSDSCGNCVVMVEKSVPGCDHKIKIKCSLPADRKYCNGRCPRLLKCGHVCGSICNRDCIQQCEQIVDYTKHNPCGHIVNKIKCFLKNIDDPEILLLNCLEKCNATLQCSHYCSGTCGACFQGRFHQKCSKKCENILVCNHQCTIPCREACKPCQERCRYKCKHSQCKKKCGDICTKCVEPCPRKCVHQKCIRKCGDICSVPPCKQPCTKKLKCKHPCVGFCGDPCPKLCRICDKEELTEFFFGTEDEEDARFVLLADCQHILESTAMEHWLNSDSDQIKPKMCPKCKSVIITTSRYSDFIKTNLKDIQNVKVRFYGTKNEIKNTTIKLQKDLENLLIINRYTFINNLIATFLQRLDDTKDNRLQHISKLDLDKIGIKVDILKMILNPIIRDNINLSDFPESTNQIRFIFNLLQKDIDSISKQESDDIVLEIDRLHRWIQFESIHSKPYLFKQEVVNNVNRISQLLKSCARYNKSTDENVKAHLEELKKQTLSAVALTDKERKEIVEAIGLTKGHWYKCPNGHPYAIGDCGGAMQLSRCNECGEEIGGNNHSLVSSNSLATEMDGATYPAWSEQANMRNYQF